ncbi:hypothetical protein [Deinococcus sp.]|uniref:hypothetical protein n=1 Tax=Deinococcus sp. TaxID=47478 RepID=UPI0025F246CA|nr:hypothetical protein [Deinococcus sp.]
MSNSPQPLLRLFRPASLYCAVTLLIGSFAAAQSTELSTGLQAGQAQVGAPLGSLELAVGRSDGASRSVRATAYSSDVGQTDSSPSVTATGSRTRPGVIALSRDLLRTFPYGSRVTLQDSAGLLNGRVFVVEDTMNARLRNTIDIWMGSRSQAYQWGARTVRMTAVR